jgi:hypothetical protein
MSPSQPTMRAAGPRRLFRAAALAGALSVTLVACGGGDDPAPAPPPPAGPSLVVKGSASRTATAAAPGLVQRLFAWLAPRSAHAQASPTGSPTSMKLRFYSLQISPNADCSGPYTVVQTFDPPRELNLFDNPTLFEGSPAGGTYRCVIFEADDLLKIVPDAVARAAFLQCRTLPPGSEYTTDLYRAPNNDFRRPDGSVIVAAGTRAAPVANRVFFYASTDRAAANARSGGPSVNQTVPLASPLVVPGQTTFYLDATNGVLGGVDDGTGFCVVEAGVMGFR